MQYKFSVDKNSEFNVCVVLVGPWSHRSPATGLIILQTNQVQSDPGASAIFATGPKPVGGHVLAHASATRIALKKGRGGPSLALRALV